MMGRERGAGRETQRDDWGERLRQDTQRDDGERGVQGERHSKMIGEREVSPRDTER